MTEAIEQYLVKKDEQNQIKENSPFYTAYCLQESIKARKEAIKADESRLAEMYKELESVSPDSVFAFANLKEVWEFPPECLEWIKANMPDVFETCYKATTSDKMKVFSACFTEAEILQFIKERNPEGYAAVAHITKTDFVKKVGKKQADSLCGIAYKTAWVTSPKTEIVCKVKPPMLEYERKEVLTDDCY